MDRRLVPNLTGERVAANLAQVRDEIAAAAARAGRDPATVEIVAAGKYVAVDDLGALADGGIAVVGENRAQDLVEKAQRWGERLTFDFIGHLQSRKVRDVVPHVRLVHSVATDSVVDQLGRHAPPGLQVLVQVNVAGEEGKDGVAPDRLNAFVARCQEVGGISVVGLMTMPPLAPDPESSRRWFAALRDLADARGLSQLSMGTTQDFAVAVEEGATIVRVGTRLMT